jgi:putative redox protein
MTAIHVTPLGKSCYGVVTGRHSLTIDQPHTSGGDDRGPNPLELFAASLTACVAHYAGSYLVRHGLSSEGLHVAANYTMASDHPARVASLTVMITPPAGLSESEKTGLLAVGSHCTVHNTLRMPPAVDIGLSEPSARHGTEHSDVNARRGSAKVGVA